MGLVDGACRLVRGVKCAEQKVGWSVRRVVDGNPVGAASQVARDGDEVPAASAPLNPECDGPTRIDFWTEVGERWRARVPRSQVSSHIQRRYDVANDVA